jgi:hypothetical protein
MHSNSLLSRRVASTALVVAACALLVALGGCRSGSRCAPACEPVSCSPTPAPQPCDRPPEAQPGEAWCRIWIPGETKTVTSRVLCKPAETKKVRIPAEYGSRPKLVCIAPAKVQEVVRPGVWKNVKKDVCVCPEREVYRKIQCDPCGQKDCWMKQKCPPVFKTECQAVCVEPPRKEVKFTPAQYKTVPERFLVRPARCETVCTPAQYRTVTKEVCCRPGRWVWRRNKDCEVPAEAPLPALEVEMVDSLPDGTEEGVFRQGATVRYNLTVRSDVGSEAMPNLRVVFTLPPQLQFVSGGGNGVTVTGDGQTATSSVFPLPLNQEVRLHILAKVVARSDTSFIQTTASVQNEAGDQLAVETESTTLTDGSE